MTTYRSLPWGSANPCFDSRFQTTGHFLQRVPDLQHFLLQRT